jgi:two-component system, NtrC family, sensor kinase
MLSAFAPQPTDPEWELPAEAVAVKIRWVGLAVGALLAALAPENPAPLAAILALGFAFTAIDTFCFLRRRVFLKDLPLAISALEALFIGLLCYFEAGLDSPFRFYYLLSLICCAVRYSALTTFATCALDCLSYAVLYAAVPASPRDGQLFALMVVVLVWVTYAAAALGRLLRTGAENLRELNRRLRENQRLLETGIAERTRELQESQAQVLHQEKMAAFGLLAAGIAHEVGNPLTGISSLLQILEKRDLEPYTRDKLGQVSGQILRIQAILRELVTFSRPASDQRARVPLHEVVREALGIAKYYKGGKNRILADEVPADLPPLTGVRDQLVQVVFNLVLNAIDATGKGGRITLSAAASDGTVELTVADDGCGIPAEAREKLFKPYYTTKKHGTGLGLFVIRKIVEEHGGTVAVESEPGSGTTFRVRWPA